MGGDENEVLLVIREASEHWPRASKAAVAQRLAERIAEASGVSDAAADRPEAPAARPRACRCRPTRPQHAAGMDLRAAVPEDEPLTLQPGDRRAVPTGLAIAIPPGFEAQVRPRSGLALRTASPASTRPARSTRTIAASCR